MRNWLVWASALVAVAAIGATVTWTSPAAAQPSPETRRERAERTPEMRRKAIQRRVEYRRRLVALRAAVMQRRLANPARFEQTRRGAQVLRGRIIAIDPSPQGIAAIQRLGMRVVRDRSIGDLGVRVLVLRAPPRLSAEDAIDVLRAADPGGAYELNHVFNPSGAGLGSGSPGQAAAGGDGAGLRLGMIDGGVDATHPALARAHIVQRAFVEHAAPSAHGTAVASILVGADAGFRGAAAGADLFAADVFGDDIEGGSAEAVADAIGWLAAQKVSVINLSLEGPPNRLVEIVCRAAQARGVILVAAVGNSGPSAPVAYPAAYPSVVAVTAVDAADRVYLMANRGPQVAFASLGVDVKAAADDGAYEAVSGTSFAAPRIAAALALEHAPTPQAAVTALASNARDLGAPGRDSTYGFGRAP